MTERKEQILAVVVGFALAVCVLWLAWAFYVPQESRVEFKGGPFSWRSVRTYKDVWEGSMQVHVFVDEHTKVEYIVVTKSGLLGSSIAVYPRLGVTRQDKKDE